jgi:hypothetical protein
MIGSLLTMAAKGFISEKVMKRVIITLGDLLVKSTKNDLDDKTWAKIKLILNPKG